MLKEFKIEPYKIITTNAESGPFLFFTIRKCLDLTTLEKVKDQFIQQREVSDFDIQSIGGRQWLLSQNKNVKSRAAFSIDEGGVCLSLMGAPLPEDDEFQFILRGVKKLQ